MELGELLTVTFLKDAVYDIVLKQIKQVKTPVHNLQSKSNYIPTLQLTNIHCYVLFGYVTLGITIKHWLAFCQSINHLSLHLTGNLIGY